MAICKRRHPNMNELTTLADIDQTPSCGVPLLDVTISESNGGVGAVKQFGH